MSIADTERIVEVVSSLVNTHGGIVVVGVIPQGKILGITIGSQTIERLTNTLTENTDPVNYPNISVHNLETRKIILKDNLIRSIGKL